MTMIVANDTPDAIRGMLKRWFIEPRPNVFVGTLTPRTHGKVMEYILRNAPVDFGILVVSSAPNCQGFVIERHGPVGSSGHYEIEIAGISLVLEKPGNEAPPTAEGMSDYPF